MIETEPWKAQARSKRQTEAGKMHIADCRLQTFLTYIVLLFLLSTASHR